MIAWIKSLFSRDAKAWREKKSFSYDLAKAVHKTYSDLDKHAARLEREIEKRLAVSEQAVLEYQERGGRMNITGRKRVQV